MDLETFLRKVLLENAIKYDGNANPGAAMGAVMREFPEYRGKAGEVQPVARRIAEEVNALSLEEQQATLEALGGSGAPEKEERDPFTLDHDSPILRFEPSPSGPMHIGHVYPLGLNHVLAERNDGNLYLRIADTNPENIYPAAYDLIPKDAQWYTHDNIEDAVIQSDRIILYYAYAEKMLTNGWAYICTCTPEAWKTIVNDKEECLCRGLPPEKHIERWELMLHEYEPGDAVMRVKTDMTHKNPAMRDWPAMRINTAEHPRQGTKYRVWPLMNFSVSVDDMEMGMTHILRAKDHADNAKRQEWMYNYFGKPIPETLFVGKINFTDLKLSTSETRKAIAEGRFSGWDDIRLPFLPALRRRGFTPEAFLRLAIEMGISAADKTVSKEEYFTNIEAFNREILDPVADRAFFVPRPITIPVKDAPDKTIEKDLHPEHRKGGRRLHVGEEMILSEDDLSETDGAIVRLMDAYNMRLDGDEWVCIGDDLEEYRKARDKRIIQHLDPRDEPIEIQVRMPDDTIVTGLAEKRVLSYDEGTVLQFERFGFVRLDNKERKEFWYAHP